MQKLIATTLLMISLTISGHAKAGILYYLENKAGGVIVLTDVENAKYCGSGPDNPWTAAFASRRDGKPVALGCWMLNADNDVQIRWFEGLTETRFYSLDAFTTTPYADKKLKDVAKYWRP